MAKRAERRADLLRMKRKAERCYPSMERTEARKLANHLQVCSCASCGNRRRFEGDSMQERRHPLPDLHEVLEDLADEDLADE